MTWNITLCGSQSIANRFCEARLANEYANWSAKLAPGWRCTLWKGMSRKIMCMCWCLYLRIWRSVNWSNAWKDAVAAWCWKNLASCRVHWKTSATGSWRRWSRLQCRGALVEFHSTRKAIDFQSIVVYFFRLFISPLLRAKLINALDRSCQNQKGTISQVHFKHCATVLRSSFTKAL